MYENIDLYQSSITNSELETFTTIEKNGGRIEKRICRKLSDLSWLDQRTAWSGLKTVFSNAHITLNSFRKLALLLHKKYLSSLSKSKKISVKKSMLNYLLNDSTLFKLIS